MNNNLQKVICFVTAEYPPDIGGVSKSANRIVNFLVDEGFNIHVFAPDFIYQSFDYNFETKFVSDTLTVHRVYCFGKSDVDQLFIECITQIDRKVRFDLFHGFYFPKAFACIKVANNKRPCIASFRGIDAIVLNKPANMKKSVEILQQSTWITSVSQESLHKANELISITNKSSLIFNSITTSDIQWSLTSKNKGNVGTVSTFRPKKNIPLLIDAFSKIEIQYRNKLILVGDFVVNKRKDMLRQNSFKKIVEYFDVVESVVETGYVDQQKVKSYLYNMNVFVLSSNHEGLPNALLEAASVGLPIVSTAVDGVIDFFENGKNALLVPLGDPVKMSRAIQRVLSDTELTETLSEGALKLAKYLSPDREKNMWVSLYNQLITDC